MLAATYRSADGVRRVPSVGVVGHGKTGEGRVEARGDPDVLLSAHDFAVVVCRAVVRRLREACGL